MKNRAKHIVMGGDAKCTDIRYKLQNVVSSKIHMTFYTLQKKIDNIRLNPLTLYIGLYA